MKVGEEDADLDWGPSGIDLAADLLEETLKRSRVMDSKTREQIDHNFTYHAPKGDQADRYTVIRNEAKLLAETIIARTPVSREQSLALTNLEQAVFWANAAIARED